MGLDEEISLLVHYAHPGNPDGFDPTFLTGCSGVYRRVFLLERMKYTIPMYIGDNLPVHDRQERIYMGSSSMLYTLDKNLVTCPNCEEFMNMVEKGNYVEVDNESTQVPINRQSDS